MRVLVTGSTGFVGAALLPRLLERSHECAALIRSRPSLPPDVESGVKVIRLSREGRIPAQEVREFNAQIVIHLAAFITSGDSTEDIDKLVESSVLFPTQLCNALEGTEVELFINTGTFAEYYESPSTPDPAYLYAAMKSAFRPVLQYYANKNRFAIAHVIPYSIYGEGAPDRIILNQLLHAATSEVSIDLSEGHQVLDFIHVSDVVEFYLRLVEHSGHRQGRPTVYHLGSGVGTSLRGLAELIGEVAGSEPAVHWGARPYRPLDVMHAVAPAQQERDALGWKPKIELKEGLRRLLVKSGA